MGLFQEREETTQIAGNRGGEISIYRNGKVVLVATTFHFLMKKNHHRMISPFFHVWKFGQYTKNSMISLCESVPKSISRKYGLRNHFWPLESVFLMRKNEKKGLNSKSPRCPIFKFFVVTREVIFPKMAPILDQVNFLWVFSLKSHCATHLALRQA